MGASIQWPVIGPTNRHSFFSQDGELDREVGERAFLGLIASHLQRVHFCLNLKL